MPLYSPLQSHTTYLSTGIRFLVHSNLFISLAATAVAISTMILADLTVELLPLFIVFAVTLFVYSFNRITDFAEDRQNMPRRAAFVRQYGTVLLGVGITLYAVATAIAILRGVPGAPALIIPLVVAVMYSVVGLKQVFLVKNLMVGLSWGLIPLGVGVYYTQLFSIDILFLCGFFTVMLMIAAVVFDIKDISGDKAEAIQTVPIVFGVEATRYLAAGSTALVAVCTVGLVVTAVLPGIYLLLLLFTAYVFCYSLVATEDGGPLFYGFIIDGEHLFLALLLVGYEFVLPGL